MNRISRSTRIIPCAILLILTWIMSSCEQVFDYHPYDGHITGETGINAKNIARIETDCKNLKEFKFAFLSDTQRWYEETEAAVSSINARPDIRFVIHGGDIADFGITNEFLWQRNILNKLKMPYVVCLGNHDCIGNGEEVFKKVFGTPNFTFQAGDVRFICLNTVALEYDYSNPVPDFGYIENVMMPEDTVSVRKTVYAMHCRPFDEQFNNNVAHYFEYCVTHSLHTQFCLCGHGHHTEISDLFKDGILYYEINNIGKRSYFIFTIKENGYDYEEVFF